MLEQESKRSDLYLICVFKHKDYFLRTGFLLCTAGWPCTCNPVSVFLVFWECRYVCHHAQPSNLLIYFLRLEVCWDNPVVFRQNSLKMPLYFEKLSILRIFVGFVPLFNTSEIKMFKVFINIKLTLKWYEKLNFVSKFSEKCITLHFAILFSVLTSRTELDGSVCITVTSEFSVWPAVVGKVYKTLGYIQMHSWERWAV